MITNEEVVESKLEDVLQGQGRRLQVRCAGVDGEGRYLLEAWIGDHENRSGQLKRGTVERKHIDEMSTSGPLRPQIDAVLGRFFQALSSVPKDPRDREMFPVFVDGITGDGLASLVRDIVSGIPNGATVEVVAKELIEKTGSRSERRSVEERVRNILDHLTLRSRLGLQYGDGRYQTR